MRVDLSPRQKVKQPINWKLLALIIAMVVYIAILGGAHYYNNIMLDKTQNEINSFKHQMKALKPKEEEYEFLEEKIKSFELDLSNKQNWAKAIYDIGYIIPRNAMLTRFDFKPEQASILATAEDTDVIVQILDNFKDSPYYYDPILKQINNSNNVENFTIDISVGQGGQKNND
ncbi:MAG: PilN domain-containing protein [bacterium]